MMGCTFVIELLRNLYQVLITENPSWKVSTPNFLKYLVPYKNVDILTLDQSIEELRLTNFLKKLLSRSCY